MYSALGYGAVAQTPRGSLDPAVFVATTGGFTATAVPVSFSPTGPAGSKVYVAIAHDAASADMAITGFTRIYAGTINAGPDRLSIFERDFIAGDSGVSRSLTSSTAQSKIVGQWVSVMNAAAADLVPDTQAAASNAAPSVNGVFQQSADSMSIAFLAARSSSSNTGVNLTVTRGRQLVASANAGASLVATSVNLTTVMAMQTGGSTTDTITATSPQAGEYTYATIVLDSIVRAVAYWGMREA